MKVKSFHFTLIGGHDRSEENDRAVNQWLDEHKGKIHILGETQSQSSFTSVNRHPYTLVVYTIRYEEVWR